jgi:hypothetical protein
VTPDEAVRAPELGDGPQDLGRLGDDDEQGARGDRGALPVRLAPEQIEVVIHPQSIVHSMVVCRDQSVLAQLGTPDMRVPIAYGLGYPDRIASGAEALDWGTLAALTFEPADLRLYPGLGLAWDALRAPPGSTASSTPPTRRRSRRFSPELFPSIGFTRSIAAPSNRFRPRRALPTRSSRCSRSTTRRACARASS